MTGITNAAGNGRFPLFGALAGAISTFVFTVVHDIFISNIWPMFVMMAVTGALCGACISWSYGLLVKRPLLGSWLTYNLIYDSMLILLGIVSVLLFEPVTTIAALLAADDLPLDLLGQSLPMAAIFTLLMAVVITAAYSFTWQKFGAVLLTSVLLVLLLGHNVFIIGLVNIPRGSFYLVVEMFGLILLINVVYALVFVVLERKRLFHSAAIEERILTDWAKIN